MYQQLGSDFLRPKRLEFSAQGYFYNSLGSVKKVGQNWKLEIKGADEPNRATVFARQPLQTPCGNEEPRHAPTDGRCAFRASGITSGYPVTQEKSINNPEPLCNLAFGV